MNRSTGRPAATACSTRPAPEERPYRCAGPPTSPVIVDGREVLAERVGGGTHERTVAGRTTDCDQGTAVTEHLVGDRCSVSRGDALHVLAPVVRVVIQASAASRSTQHPRAPILSPSPSGCSGVVEAQRVSVAASAWDGRWRGCWR